MSDNFLPDGLKKLSAYQDRLPGHRANARVHLSTLIRLCTKGTLLPDGSRLRLRAVRCGASWLCCDQWFDEYVAALTAAHLPPDAPRPGAVRGRPPRGHGPRRRRTGRWRTSVPETLPPTPVGDAIATPDTNSPEN